MSQNSFDSPFANCSTCLLSLFWISHPVLKAHASAPKLRCGIEHEISDQLPAAQKIPRAFWNVAQDSPSARERPGMWPPTSAGSRRITFHWNLSTSPIENQARHAPGMLKSGQKSHFYSPTVPKFVCRFISMLFLSPFTFLNFTPSSETKRLRRSSGVELNTNLRSTSNRSENPQSVRECSSRLTFTEIWTMNSHTNSRIHGVVAQIQERNITSVHRYSQNSFDSPGFVSFHLWIPFPIDLIELSFQKSAGEIEFESGSSFKSQTKFTPHDESLSLKFEHFLVLTIACCPW